MREQVFFVCNWFFWVRRVCESMWFKRSLIPSGPALFFQKRHRARTGFYIHYLLFMSESRVSECMSCKLVEFKRWRARFFKSSFNARQLFWHQPPAVHDWEECVRVYFLSAGSVQTVSHPFVDKRESAMREHVCHVHHLLFMIDESLSEYMFPQTVPHHLFWKRVLNQG